MSGLVEDGIRTGPRTHGQQDACLEALNLQDAYWHVLTYPGFRKFLAYQMGARVVQFTVLPFGLNIAPKQGQS